jgi:hypothetical protein
MNAPSAKQNLTFAVVGVFVLMACAAVKGVVRTLNDIAKDLCALTASEQLERDGAALDGLSVAQWCDIKENLDPFIDEVLKAQKLAAGQAGLTAAPE